MPMVWWGKEIIVLPHFQIITVTKTEFINCNIQIIKHQTISEKWVKKDTEVHSGVNKNKGLRVDT